MAIFNSYVKLPEGTSRTKIETSFNEVIINRFLLAPQILAEWHGAFGQLCHGALLGLSTEKFGDAKKLDVSRCDIFRKLVCQESWHPNFSVVCSSCMYH